MFLKVIVLENTSEAFQNVSKILGNTSETFWSILEIVENTSENVRNSSKNGHLYVHQKSNCRMWCENQISPKLSKLTFFYFFTLINIFLLVSATGRSWMYYQFSFTGRIMSCNQQHCQAEYFSLILVKTRYYRTLFLT